MYFNHSFLSKMFQYSFTLWRLAGLALVQGSQIQPNCIHHPLSQPDKGSLTLARTLPRFHRKLSQFQAGSKGQLGNIVNLSYTYGHNYCISLFGLFSLHVHISVSFLCLLAFISLCTASQNRLRCPKGTPGLSTLTH